jgi:hypothetical protein
MILDIKKQIVKQKKNKKNRQKQNQETFECFYCNKFPSKTNQRDYKKQVENNQYDDVNNDNNYVIF